MWSAASKSSRRSHSYWYSCSASVVPVPLSRIQAARPGLAAQGCRGRSAGPVGQTGPANPYWGGTSEEAAPWALPTPVEPPEPTDASCAVASGIGSPSSLMESMLR